jgi:hypothetical protein
MCECYQIGGPFIAEDPDCEVHGSAARSLRAETEEVLRYCHNMLAHGTTSELQEAFDRAIKQLEKTL